MNKIESYIYKKQVINTDIETTTTLAFCIKKQNIKKHKEPSYYCLSVYKKVYNKTLKEAKYFYENENSKKEINKKEFNKHLKELEKLNLLE